MAEALEGIARDSTPKDQDDVTSVAESAQAAAPEEVHKSASNAVFNVGPSEPPSRNSSVAPSVLPDTVSSVNKSEPSGEDGKVAPNEPPPNVPIVNPNTGPSAAPIKPLDDAVGQDQLGEQSQIVDSGAAAPLHQNQGESGSKQELIFVEQETSTIPQPVASEQQMPHEAGPLQGSQKEHPKDLPFANHESKMNTPKKPPEAQAKESEAKVYTPKKPPEVQANETVANIHSPKKPPEVQEDKSSVRSATHRVPTPGSNGTLGSEENAPLPSSPSRAQSNDVVGYIREAKEELGAFTELLEEQNHVLKRVEMRGIKLTSLCNQLKALSEDLSALLQQPPVEPPQPPVEPPQPVTNPNRKPRHSQTADNSGIPRTALRTRSTGEARRMSSRAKAIPDRNKAPVPPRRSNQ